MRGLIAALDLGSTSFKARLYDGDLKTLEQAAEPLAYRRRNDGTVEIAHEEVDRAASSALERALAGGGRGELAALAVTSQAQTLAVLDGEGRPRTPFVSWMDTRGRAAAARLASERAFARFADHASFGEPIAGLALCILAAMVEREPHTLAPPCRPAFLSSYVVERLTGHAVMDDNLAAMTGLYSLPLGDWWPAALERLGLDRAQLPRLAPVGSAAGPARPCSAAWAVPAGTMVVLAGNDQTAGAYASGIHLDGSLLVTLGTAQVAYRVMPTAPAPRPGLFRGPYPGGRSYCAAVDEGGGSLVSWACSVLAGCAGPEDFFALAARSPAGARGLRFSPGTWEGLTPAHGPEELARSVLEHLVRQAVEVVRRVEPSPEGLSIRLAGGGSRQPLWIELLAGALGASLSPAESDPLLGAARLAREALDAPPANPSAPPGL